MRILLTRKLHDFAVKELKKRYTVEINRGKTPMSKKEILLRIKDKDGLICFPYDIIDSEIIDAAKNLKAISTYSVGYDHIDIEHAIRKGIVVSYTPEVLTRATADLTIALILALVRRVVEGDRIIRHNKWKTIFGPYDFLGIDLYGKTLGIFGIGRIGKAVAKRVKGFEMNVLYHSNHKLPARTERNLGIKYVSFKKLFEESDIITIHTPHTKETHEIVNLQLLKRMKPTAFLINTARGRIIREKDLIFALQKKIIAGAALDVFQKEPIHRKNPFTKMNNVVLTPHIGSSTEETRRKMAEIAIENLILSLSGKNPKYLVSPY
ncbi:MAG TPA: D-glycerate dehydrogenase [Nitrosopumilaceae archaeon]|nr:D-glycerate dehydrogenase [Nitrosopumilaceae archaeon]